MPINTIRTNKSFIEHNHKTEQAIQNQDFKTAKHHHSLSLGLKSKITEDEYITCIPDIQPIQLNELKIPLLLVKNDIIPISILENKDQSFLEDLKKDLLTKDLSIELAQHYDYDPTHNIQSNHNKTQTENPTQSPPKLISEGNEANKTQSSPSKKGTHQNQNLQTNIQDKQNSSQQTKSSIYIAKDPALIQQLIHLDASKNNLPKDQFVKLAKQIGQILKYPECCIDFYCKKTLNNHDMPWKQAVYYETTNQQLPFEKELNFLLPFKTFFHYPCSFNCQKTKELVQERLTLLKEKEFPDLQAHIDTLQQPIWFFDYFRYVIFNGTPIKENNHISISYHSITSFLNFNPRFIEHPYYKMFYTDIIHRCNQANKIIFKESTIELYKDNNFIYEWDKEEYSGFTITWE